MSCKRYWHEGILLAEQGAPDEHRESCAACRDQHSARNALIQAMSSVIPDTGDPAWRAGVWNRIERLGGTRRRSWLGAGSLLLVASAAACAVVIAWRTSNAPTPRMQIIPGVVAMRSSTLSSEGRLGGALVGDFVRVARHSAEDVRIYRAGRLVLRCAPGHLEEGCVANEQGQTALLVLRVAGDYQIVVLAASHITSTHELAADLEAIDRARIEHELVTFLVH